MDAILSLYPSAATDGYLATRPPCGRGAPARRCEGRSKGRVSVQYPHVIEKDASLGVIYSTNKEDIEISQFHIADFGLGK